ncbi:crossover junction endodeoxyribonuclease RuvC [Methanocella paludicola SANAE]|uniref:Crossover junction endodeoxyribonuclease RuvC n=1 Tax=Methanocella paludicola (strain DSM 17711 / JCM 13418 / NBRC 101707 / SANAE) TaxID=304371 RepID=D1Z100_METPS|nr:crossover junction endodeoxyribonuclease RuvC [Methanocella paludicola]BAI62372.1 crossover junction endodeoxyribonuclease RuvC [Methanocella paludicola SANAE]
MRILGIDPGIALTGFGIVEKEGVRIKAGRYGHISTESGTPVPDRLKILYDDMVNIVQEYRPEVMVVEELFFNKNAKTAIIAAQARGVIILSAVNNGVKVEEYTPLQVKQAVIGYGRASKQQVQFMVKELLRLKEIPKPDDTADALAIAICHANSMDIMKNLDRKSQ